MAEAHRAAAATAGGQVDQVPGTAAAVAIATDAVPIIAWCSLPIDSARTLQVDAPSHRCPCRWTTRSPSAAPRRRSSACAGACRGLRHVVIRPMRTAPAARIASSLASIALSPLIAGCSSVPS
jgi:hypothetical protein